MKECPKCKGKTLTIYSQKIRIDLQEDKWVLVMPLHKIELDDRYKLYCYDCHEQFQLNLYRNQIQLTHHPEKTFAKFFEGDMEFYMPVMNQKKVVLDLDDTVIGYNRFVEDKEPDFTFPSQQYPKHNVRAWIRPHFKEFIKALEDTFEEIEIFSNSLEKDVEYKVEALGLDKYPHKDFRDAGRCIRTPMRWEKEYLKDLDNVVTIDDRPEVINGRGNIILDPTKWYVNEDDTDLLKIVEYLKNPSKGERIDIPKEFKVVIKDLWLEGCEFKIELKEKFSLDKIDELEKVLLEYVGTRNRPDEKAWVSHHFNDDVWKICVSVKEDTRLEEFYKAMEDTGFSIKRKVSRKKFDELIEIHKKEREKRFNF